MPAQIISSAVFAAITVSSAPAATAGPGCPDAGALLKLTDCLRDHGCEREASLDELRGLKKRVLSSTPEIGLLGGQRVEVSLDGQGALIVLDGQADLPRAVTSLFSGHPGLPGSPGGGGTISPATGTATPVSGTALAASVAFPCGVYAPCRPPGAEPQCPGGSNPGPRDVIRLLPDGPTQQPPGCLPCDVICQMNPRPADCPCARSCPCSGTP